MKVALVRQRYTASGGAERYLDALMQELKARGHEIHLFAANWPAAHNKDFTFHHIPVVRAGSFFKALTFALASKRVLAECPCDLVFSLERTLRQDVYRAGDGCHREWLLQRRRFAGPLKQAALSASFFHRLMLALEKRTFSSERTGWIIANSQRGKEEIVRHYGFPPARITVIYNGVDLEKFNPDDGAWNDRSHKLLFVGTGFERKGLEFCLRALAALPEVYRLRIVGKGNVEKYKRMAAGLGVDNRIEFLGHNLKMPEIYRGAGFLLHPAIYEPFANVCLEAMASGVPPIVVETNGVAEILDRGLDGAMIRSPSDADGLARAVQQFAKENRWREVSHAARKKAEKFPFSRNVSETLSLLQSRLNSAGELALKA